jgi:hypothetical protein
MKNRSEIKKRAKWLRLFAVMNSENELLLTALRDCLLGNQMAPIDIVRLIDEFEDELLEQEDSITKEGDELD